MSKKNPFPYPGGKALTAPKIIDKFPDHEVYVEPFGGAASVLCQKSPKNSKVEVYNDLNDDVVLYFEVARERPDELMNYLEKMPYSRSLHQEILTRWFDQENRPNDDIQRAAEFVFLRTANQNSLFGRSGFQASRKRNQAERFRKVSKRVSWVSDRFSSVTIESQDWKPVSERYDGPETLFYFDPPYLHVDDERMYAEDPASFDHERFVQWLLDSEGRWIVSYSDLPDALEGKEFTVVQWEKKWDMGKGKEGQEEVFGKESLVMNYDPSAAQPPTQQGAPADAW